ncbi:MAG: glycerol-3-phosphate 1-O-acyltransferase PlsY [Bacteroidales bacterium]|nr:glycerol-3-phosphate 1-O-acyltransferase PlsY [Bacteroidales bacterium]
MEIFTIVCFSVIAYLLGSIPTAVWIGKIFYKIDIREHGSGNAGATNTFRVLGTKAGIPVLIFDIFKGFLASSLVVFSDTLLQGTKEYVNVQLLLGSLSVIGHIFPIYEGFKGGKGVAALLGVILAITPIPGMFAIGIFLISLFISKYVSLSSIIAGVSFPIMVILIFKTPIISLMIFSIVIAVLLLFTHHKNIERLLKKEESKANISLRRKK